ncbi:DNA-directed DNA polymerase [Tanacetum coccineum]
MAVRTQPTLSLAMSARIAEAVALSPSSFHKRYRSSYETSSSLPALPILKRYRGTSELVEDTEDESSDSGTEREGLEGEGHSSEDEGPGSEDEGLGLEEEAAPEGQQQAALAEDTTVDEPLGLGYRALRCRDLALGEGSVPNTFKVGQSSRSVPEHEGAERIFTPPSLEWSSSSLPISPSSPAVPSPIASPVTTLAATISVDEDHFLEVGAQLELYGSILYDHTQRLDALPPTLFEGYDQDLRELYTRSGARENQDLRRQIAEKRRERLELTDRVARIKRIQEPIRRIHQGRYGVSVPALTKDHRGIKLNMPYPERLNTPYLRNRTQSRLRPYHFNYPERSLTMEEMLNKFIDEGKREHEEMRTFIYDFQTTNELLTTTQDVHNNNTNVLPKEPLVVELEKPVGKNDVLTNDQPQMTSEPVVQPSNEVQTPPVPFPRIEAVFGKFEATPHQLAFHRSIISNAKVCQISERSRSCISLMPYTMYKKLGLGELKATRMSLELADRLIQYPRGIIENVLIRVDKFVLPIDFVILDMPEDSRVPIILGRPFLATARAMIDVFNKKITLRVRDDEVIFDVNQSIKRPTTEDDECYGIDDFDDTINEEAQELLANEEPDSFLSGGLEKSIDQSDLECCESASSNGNNESDLENLIRRINSANTPANEINEKKPELKNLPQHLEYAYLQGDKSFPIIISSELSKKEKISLLQVLERRKGVIA